MSRLRNVGGWGEVDLDQRAITTEDDIVDLSELDQPDDQHNESAPATQNGTAGHDEPGEAQPSATASPPNRDPTARETPPASDGPGQESDEDFDRWVAHRAHRAGTTPSASTSSTARLASDVQEQPSGGAPPIAPARAGVPPGEPTVPAVTTSPSRLRRSGPLSLPLGRLARPAAVIVALTLTAGGTAIAINAATTSVPRGRPEMSTSNAARAASQNNPLGDVLSATIAAVAPDLRALARAGSPAHRASHPTRKPRRHHTSRHPRVPVEHHPTAVSERTAPSAQTSPAPQTYNYTPAPAASSRTGTSQTTAGSQTQATSRSQPAFGANGTLGPGRGAPGTQ
jgi:hypothetical protein